MKIKHDEVMDDLLKLYDFYIRLTLPTEADDYDYGYADAIGQCVLNIGKTLGEGALTRPYKYEVYKRVMQYYTTANYIKQYPAPPEEDYLNLIYPRKVSHED